MLRVILSIFKRNFISYFANPTGYVFICVFVLVSGFAAFWPHEFFNASLANLDQLNKYMPFILLGFVPAITMSMWADERRQGTDELLLTIPASDFAVVLGKFLAATAIFTIALLFSLTNVIVLDQLGDPDRGLMAANYVGYWLMGVSMLSIGMVASFLTSNLTIAFVLGVALNAPLVFAAEADLIIADPEITTAIRRFSMAGAFGDFARGVVSASSLFYFVGLTALMLYLSVVLIGRRHWVTGGGGGSMLPHFVLRTVGTAAAVVGAVAIFAAHDVRVDASTENLNSLSPKTHTLLDALHETGDDGEHNQRPVHIEAFISPEADVPESYIKTRLDLLTILNELGKHGGGRVTVEVNETPMYSPLAQQAKNRFGIEAREVFVRHRGRPEQRRFIMGVAVTSGLDRVVVPFFNRGIPPEFELVRAISSLSKETRQKIGVVRTNERFVGAKDEETGRRTQEDHPLVTELKKQYDVEEVDPSEPISDEYAMLLVVQPSGLLGGGQMGMPDPEALDHVLDAIGRGVPTAIFEDPLLLGRRDPQTGGSTGTTRIVPNSAPRFPGDRGNPQATGHRLQPTPGMDRLWSILGVNFMTDSIVWHDFDPFPEWKHLPDEFVFVGPGSDIEHAYNPESDIVSGLGPMLMLTPGAITKADDANVTFTPLVRTGSRSGRVELLVNVPRFNQPDEAQALYPAAGPFGLHPERVPIKTEKQYILAAHLTGKPRGAESDINVVLVADANLLDNWAYTFSEIGEGDEMQGGLDIDNVIFIHNVIDKLAGDDRFIDIRKRDRAHRTLSAFQQRTDEATVEAKTRLEEIDADYREQIKAERERLAERIEKINENEDLDYRSRVIRATNEAISASRVEEVKRRELELKSERERKKIDDQLQLEIAQMQNRVKRAAVFIPPLIPLVLAIGVFLIRRQRELMGASARRLR